MFLNIGMIRVDEVMESIYDKTKTKIDFRKIES